MISIAGTVRNAVQFAVLESKWLQKKESGLKKDEGLTADERMLQQFQEDMRRQRRQNDDLEIYNKIIAGRKLTSKEIEYLRKNNPEALKEYEEIIREREAYERQLKNCRTKEEVERLKVQKMNGYLAEAKKISVSANIPKGKKAALLQKILAKVWNVQEIHMEFVKSAQFRELPTEQEQRAGQERKTETSEQAGTEPGIEKNIPESSDGEPDVTGETETETASLSFTDVRSAVCDLMGRNGGKYPKMNVTV